MTTCITGSAFRIPHSVFRILHSAFRIPHSVFGIPCFAFLILHSAFRIPHSTFKCLAMVHGGQDKAGRVPDLVREVAVSFDALFRQVDVAPLGSHDRQGETHRIHAVFVDHVNGVDGVPQRFGHLASLCVADQGRDIDLPEWDVFHEVQAHHHHASDPKVNDVMAGNQDAGGIEGLQFRGPLGPAHGGERPQRRGEPGIQYIGILVNLVASTMGAA